MLRRLRAAQHRGADRLTVTGLLDGERGVWLSLLEGFREDGTVPPTLAFLTNDLQPPVFAPQATQDHLPELTETRSELKADAVLYGGSRRVDDHVSRLTLYTYWHSARGRRIKVAERVDGVVRELDMKGAKELSSWVEELFADR